MRAVLRAFLLYYLLFFSCELAFAQGERSLKDDLHALNFSWGLTPELNAEMDKGLDLLRRKEVKAALKKFEYILNTDTTCFPAWYCLKMYAHEPAYTPILNKKDHFSFVVAYKQLWDLLINDQQSIDPSNPQFQFCLEVKNMISYQARKLEHRTDPTASLLKNSIQLIFAGDFIQSKKIAAEIAVSSPGPEVFYLKAFHHRILDQQDSAMIYYIKTAELDSNIVDVHRNLAIYKTALKDYTGALSHLDHLTRLVPLTGGLAKFAGLLWAEAGDYQDAAIAFDVCVKENPNDLECLKQRAIARYNTKEYRLAVADLDWLIKLARFDIESYVYQSDCLLAMGDTLASIKTLKKAKKVAGFDPLLDLKLIEKQIIGKEYGSAQSELSRVTYVLATNGSPAEVGYWAAFLQVKLSIGKEKFEKALEQINDLIRKAGERDEYLFTRAKLYVAMNVKDLAKGDLKKLKTKNYQPAIDLWNELQLK